MKSSALVAGSCALVLGLALGSSRAGEEEADWVDLSTLDAWQAPIEGWAMAGSVMVDPKDPYKLAQESGAALFTNGPAGHARNLVSKETFGDVALHVEFFIPKGSNSGVKFQAVYEVQIFDSHGVKALRGSDCGGIYPRSEEKPFYHHIDGGHPPILNASKPFGEWQAMDLTFLAPRFDEKGAKVADARITVVLNGQKVQDELKATTPTGAAWHDKEKTTGPILLQADHGPVAFRNIKARRLVATP